MRIQTIVLLLAAAGAAHAQDKPGWLGVSVAPLSDEVRVAYRVPASVTEGAVIREVVGGSAAERAGFRSGDVVVSFLGKPIRGPEDLIAAIQAQKAGASCGYTLRRGTGMIEGTLNLGTRPGDEPAREPERPPPPKKAAPATPPAKKDLEGRLDDLDETLKRLRERARRDVEGGGPRRARPRGLDGWIQREAASLERARAGGNEKEIHFHEIRLELLRELRKANVGGGRGGPRFDRIERKLDEILKLLRQK